MKLYGAIDLHSNNNVPVLARMASSFESFKTKNSQSLISNGGR